MFAYIKKQSSVTVHYQKKGGEKGQYFKLTPQEKTNNLQTSKECHDV